MIHVRVYRADGYYKIELIGHAREDVCAGASMIAQAAALGLRDLGRQYPRQIDFVCEGEGGYQVLDSPDARKR